MHVGEVLLGATDIVHVVEAEGLKLMVNLWCNCQEWSLR